MMIKGFLYVAVSFALLIAAYLNSDSYKKQNAKMINYLPLGDSYTIGTGALEKEAWPYLLAEHLNANKISCRLLDNPARNGFTTQDLINKELPLVKKLRPDFVTLLIGVNDWVQGVTTTNYHKNLIYILDEVEREITDRKNIILVTIPDFGVTPSGKEYSHGKNISEGISEFNELIKLEARKRGLSLVDIFVLSKKMGDDTSLIAHDGLHPSAREYAMWEAMILPEAIKLLK